MRFPRSASLAFMLLGAGPALAEVPNVVVSIAPLHSLVASVMYGVGEPTLLVPSDVSDHDHAMRPSDLRAIAAADLVVWIGEPLEAYLVAALEAEGTPNLELLDAPGIDAHPYQSGGEAEPHDGQAADEGDHNHDHLGLDPHLWLDPIRAQTIVAAVAGRLAEIDPENAATYRENATKVSRDLAALDTEIQGQLAPFSEKPFITFHDGYSYFVERYGLNQVGELAVDPERRPGAATVQALQERVAADGVACAFAEPQFDAGVVEALAGEADIRIGVLDALGAGLEAGPGLYGELMRRNAEAIETCLSPSS